MQLQILLLTGALFGRNVVVIVGRQIEHLHEIINNYHSLVVWNERMDEHQGERSHCQI